MNTSQSSTAARHTIVAGMSGGVDSSVAAMLLRNAGYDVTGVFMKNWEEDDDGYCAAAEDLADVESVCRRLSIPLRTVNFATEYWDRVFEQFVLEHERGLTPNPDILCNREIKFREFHYFAMDLGVEQVATGHYARTAPIGHQTALLKARDESKDQTYFLYAVDQVSLARTVFPLGELLKSDVRRLAADAHLAVATKRDSTGICFVGERPFREFLSRFVSASPGPIVNEQGAEIGTHPGAIYYTIGQRQGLGIGGQTAGSGDPWYVAEKDLPNNRLLVVQGNTHPRLYHDRLRAGELHWISGIAPALPLVCNAKVRYRHREQPCEVRAVDEAHVEVRFESPQWAVTPGQSVVFYDGEICLGGGTIETAWRGEG
ncbi:MAG: tRNA 2-thiouridine(34) synthase MnmA [Pseudomonadota bacterium]